MTATCTVLRVFTTQTLFDFFLFTLQCIESTEDKLKLIKQ